MHRGYQLLSCWEPAKGRAISSVRVFSKNTGVTQCHANRKQAGVGSLNPGVARLAGRDNRNGDCS